MIDTGGSLLATAVQQGAELRPRPAGVAPPLSAVQERLWFLQRSDPDDSSYNTWLVLRLRGPLDRAALAAALRAVVARQESLRTSFADIDGEPAVVIHQPGALTPGLEQIDLSGAGARERALSLVSDRVNAPFDLAAGPPARYSLLGVAPGDHFLCLVLHPIIADGWSHGVLLDDLFACYQDLTEGREPTLPALPVQLGDIALWQRQRESGQEAQDSLAYWRGRLADPPSLQLPLDRPRGQRPVWASQPFRIPAELTGALDRLAQRHDASLFMLLVAAYQALLARHTGQDDILVGATCQARDSAETERVIGSLTDILAVRGDLSGDPSFGDLLGATRRSLLEAHAHRGIPFERLIGEMGLSRDIHRNPLLSTVVTLHSQVGDGGPGQVGDLTVEVADPGFKQAKFDLSLEAWPDCEGLLAMFRYDAGLFHAATVEALSERLIVALRAAVEAPDTPVSRLPMLTATDLTAIEDASTGPAARRDDLVPELFARAVAGAPKATALAWGSGDGTGAGQLSYGELDARVTRIAAALRRGGLTPGDVVGVCLGRSADTVAAMLAVWRAGGAYLPLDPDYPDERLAFMVADSAARLVVTSAALAHRSPPGAGLLLVESVRGKGGGGPWPVATPGQPAYVIYTSGSTGRPKGVLIEHGALANRVWWMREAYGIGPADRVAQFASLSFDAHIEELYPALAAGASVLLLPDGSVSLPDALRTPAGREVTVLDLPTAYWHRLTEALDDVTWPTSLRLVIIGGEQAHAAAVTRWRAGFGDRVRLVNTYGPTEATVIATTRTLDAADTRQNPPIGRPVGGTTARVLGRDGSLVPPGVPGELHLGGAGLARGYLGRPALTAERFVPDPYGPPGARLYRTGDRVRLRPDGDLEFLGRLDGQLKVRGFRVEPGEVTAALLTHPGVRQAAVTADGDRLVAYVAGTAERAQLRRHLAATLPAYLVPTDWVAVDELPLTVAGKVDLAAMAAPPPVTQSDTRAAAAGPADLAPAGPEGRAAASALSPAKRALLAQRLRRGAAAAPRRTIPAIPPGQSPPLSHVQEWLWFLEQYAPGTAWWTIPVSLRLRGQLDAAALGDALNAVVARHDALRMRYQASWDGKPQVVIADDATLPLTVASAPDDEAAKVLADEFLAMPFDLATGPVARALLIRLGADDHVLVLGLHHIAADGWSVDVLLREVFAQLDGQTPASPEVSFADYAAWQRGLPVPKADLEFWRNQVAGIEPLDLPTDRPRPAERTSNGAMWGFLLRREPADALRRLGREHGATLFMTVLAGFAALLGRYAGTDDVAVGSPSAGRQEPELDGVIGCFLTMLTLRVDLSGDPTFGELLDRARELSFDAFAHQGLSFEQLIGELNLPRDLSRSPLFDVMLSMQNYRTRAVDPPAGLTVADFPRDDWATRYDLEAYVADDPSGGLTALLVYNTDLFDQATIERLAVDMRTLFERVASQPGLRLSEIGLPGAGATGRRPQAALPRGQNGRLDRRARPAPDPATRPAAPSAPAAPGTPTEQALAAIWGDLLGVAQIGVDDDFFDLGGHSLLATQVAARLRRAAGVQVAVIDVFKYPTIRQLAAIADTPLDGRGARALLHRLTPAHAGPPALSYVCVPHGGASAVVYQPLADALPADHALWSVSIPGNDVGVDEAALPFDELAAACVTEILAKVSGPLVVYAHSAVGSALGVEIARRLEAAGRDVDALYIGGAFPFARPEGRITSRLTRIVEADRLRSNQRWVNWLISLGLDMSEIDPAQARLMVSNMRRGARESEEYYTRLLATGAGRLRAPVITVVGGEDPATEFYEERYREWHFMTSVTAVAVLAEAGHFFQKYRVRELAEIITTTHRALAADATAALRREARGPGATWWLHGVSRSGAAVTPPGVQPSFKRFFPIAASQLVSGLGSAMTEFAVPLWIYTTTGSVAKFALMAVVGLVPGLLALPVAGALVDRASRRKVMLAGDSAALGVQLVFGTLLWTGHLSIAGIYPLLGCLSVALTFQRIAYMSAVPQLVPKRSLGHAVGLMQLGTGTAQLTVPIFAVGLLAGIGLGGIVGLDIASYAVAIVTLLLVRFPATMAWRRKEPFLAEMLGGLRYSLGSRGFVGMLAFFAVMNIFLSPLMLMFGPLVLSFGKIADVGRISALAGVGVVAGGLTMMAWGGPRHSRLRGVLLCTVALGCFCVIAGLRANLVVIAVGVCGMTAWLTLLNGIYTTIVQVKVPQRFHGRVFAIQTLIAWSTLPIGYGLVAPNAVSLLSPLMAKGGALASTAGALLGTGHGRGMGLMYVLFGLVVVAVALIGLRVPVLARFDRDVPDAVADDLVGLQALRSPGTPGTPGTPPSAVNAPKTEAMK